MSIDPQWWIKLFKLEWVYKLEIRDRSLITGREVLPLQKKEEGGVTQKVLG